jgi:hypothetical protein
MASIVRNFVLAPAVMAAAALATNTAMAETMLKVPFSFTVAGKTCPAGIYEVEREVSSNLVILTSKDASRSFSWVVSPGAPSPTDSAVILRFDNFGQTHVLQSVQYGPLITSRLDKKIMHAPTEIVTGQ